MPPDEKRIRTLVFDDASDFMQAICPFLENLPNVVVIATGCTGYDAIVLAHEWMPDLVLMDIRMPEMMGLEATSRLTRELPDVIIILMTSFEDEKTLRASKESGAFAFVMKKNLTHDLPRYLNWQHRKRDGC
jgi:CheY-like chemotaxis protein